MESITADFQPAFQKIELRALAGAVGTFDDNERTGISAAGYRSTGLRECGFCGFWPRGPCCSVLIFHGRGGRLPFKTLSVVFHCYWSITTQLRGARKKLSLDNEENLSRVWHVDWIRTHKNFFGLKSPRDNRKKRSQRVRVGRLSSMWLPQTARPRDDSNLEVGLLAGVLFV